MNYPCIHGDLISRGMRQQCRYFFCHRLVFAAVLTLMLFTGCDQAPPNDNLLLGSPFPSLELHPLGEGKVTSIDALQGKLIILNVWATWCAPCRKELPGLERLSKKLDPQRFAVIGLSVDSDVIAAREYLNDKKVTFANYIDPEMKIARELLGVRIFPDTFIISPSGNLLRSIGGDREWDSPEMIEILEQGYAGNSARLAEV